MWSMLNNYFNSIGTEYPLSARRWAPGSEAKVLAMLLQ